MPVTPQKEARPRATTVRSAENNHVGTQLDLRGKHYEEALAKVDQCIDATTLTGYPQVTTAHDRGTGTSRTGITEFLRSHHNVKSYEFVPQNQGGNDVIVIRFQ